MTDIEFVIEVPQATRTNKKRPRLVTSCDHCRVKKIKCVQQPDTGKCEACASASLPCLYRDREQYFAERTRLMSGAGSALRDASGNAQNSDSGSIIDAATPPPSRGPTPPQSYLGDNITPTTSDRSYSPSSYVDMASLDINNSPTSTNIFDSQPFPTWDNPTRRLPRSPRQTLDTHPGMGSIQHCPASVSQVPPLLGLFDPSDWRQPHPNLMMSFLHVFFDRLESSYPFLSSERICEQFLHGRLSALLANAIAASAAHFSTVAEIVQIGPANAADVYCQAAKNLIPPESSATSLDTLHAFMLLAWAAYKRRRQSAFNGYARLAMRHAADLGISDESLPQLTPVTDTHGARVLQSTWHGIQLLERTLLASELVALSASHHYAQSAGI